MSAEGAGLPAGAGTAKGVGSQALPEGRPTGSPGPAEGLSVSLPGPAEGRSVSLPGPAEVPWAGPAPQAPLWP